MRTRDEPFLALLRPEEGKLLRIARALTGREADAWEMVQDAVVQAYERFDTLRGGPESFAPWLRRILVNRCKNLLRGRARLVLLETAAETEVDPAPGPEAQLEASQLWGEVMELAEDHRQVLTLRFLVDMPVPEIAALLGVPEGTIKSRLHRALGALRKRLQSTDEGVRHG
jgi:RNA polymerase sigma factor (sigma-70 family)